MILKKSELIVIYVFLLYNRQQILYVVIVFVLSFFLGFICFCFGILGAEVAWPIFFMIVLDSV